MLSVVDHCNPYSTHVDRNVRDMYTRHEKADETLSDEEVKAYACEDAKKFAEQLGIQDAEIYVETSYLGAGNAGTNDPFGFERYFRWAITVYR